MSLGTNKKESVYSLSFFTAVSSLGVGNYTFARQPAVSAPNPQSQKLGATTPALVSQSFSLKIHCAKRLVPFIITKKRAFSALSLTENTLKLSLPFGQVKLSAIVKFTS